MALEDKIETRMVWNVTILGSVVLLLVILAVQALWAFVDRSLYENRVLNAEDTARQRVEAEHRKEIHGEARWIDKAKGKVAIPIERAMSLILQETKDKK